MPNFIANMAPSHKFIDEWLIKIDFFVSKDNVADIFTKSLNETLFKEHSSIFYQESPE